MSGPRGLAPCLLLACGLIAAAPRAAEPAASPEEVTPPSVGDTLPALTLTTADGTPFDLNVAVAERPTLLILYRGGW